MRVMIANGNMMMQMMGSSATMNENFLCGGPLSQMESMFPRMNIVYRRPEGLANNAILANLCGATCLSNGFHSAGCGSGGHGNQPPPPYVEPPPSPPSRPPPPPSSPPPPPSPPPPCRTPPPMSPPPPCGDSMCDPLGIESWLSCPEDCQPVCGNGVCECTTDGNHAAEVCF